MLVTTFSVKKSAALLVLSAGLAACSSGFHAPGVLQPQSSAIDADKVAPDDSIKQMQSNNDALTKSQDPILGNSTNRNTSYKLPDNTSETIRVRLMPITTENKDDPYHKSLGTDTLSLANENGLIIKDLALNNGEFLKSGTTVSVIFSKKQLTIDGKNYQLSAASQLGIFPRMAGSLTQVSLKLDQARLELAKIVVAKSGELPFRGIFLLRQIDHSATKKQAAVTNWNLINYVALEDYVRAVVPSEIGASSADEALKAQALATRTFAARQMVLARCIGHQVSHCEPRVWDVDPSTSYQSFVGALAEKQTTFAAIDSTKDQILNYQGAPILAMFSARSGGETVSIGEYSCKRFTNAKTRATCESRYAAQFPYLSAKADPYNGTVKRFGHGVGLPQQSAQVMAKAGHSVAEIVALYYEGSTIEKLDFQ